MLLGSRTATLPLWGLWLSVPMDFLVECCVWLGVCGVWWFENWIVDASLNATVVVFLLLYQFQTGSILVESS